MKGDASQIPESSDGGTRRKTFRRRLRREATSAEKLMWAILRDRRLGDYKFRRQHSIGPFIVDFVCLEQMLVIEIDGGYHDYVVTEDLDRQAKLESLGFTVLRFENDDVLKDAEAVAQAIQNALKQ